MKASEAAMTSYSVSIRAAAEYIFDSIPSSADIFAALSSLADFKTEKLLLSDCFAKGFVYKPFSFDTVRLSSKEEYRIFKVCKKAEYIEKDLLDSLSSPESLTQLLCDGAVKVKDSHIYSTLNGFSSPFSRSIEPSSVVPVKTKIKKGALLEFYVAKVGALPLFAGDEIEILGHSFTVESVKELNPGKSSSCLLLSPMKTDGESAKLPLSFFRLGFSASAQTQFFLPGSVFSSFPQLIFEDKAPCFAPFLISCNV